MSGEDDTQEKEFEPTQHKLDEARKRGEVVKSADLLVAAGYGGLLLVGLSIGAPTIVSFSTGAMVLLDQAESLAPLFLSGETGLAGGLIGGTFLAIAPWFVGPAVLVLATIFAQRALVFAPDKLMPKLSRISPLTNLGNKFGREGLFEFAKSTVKLAVISGLLGVFLFDNLPPMLGTIYLSPAMVSAVLMGMIGDFLFLVLIIAGSIGAIDYLWQHSQFIRRNRMSRQEMMDEMKRSEGDPQVKQQRRQRAYDIASNRMLAEVPKADVVIVNPTHYAVALKWDRASGRAPVCVAKGVDEVAARIREAAMAAGVPLHSDPPTARALHAAVDLGKEIQPAHYRAVAAAVRFAEKMRQRARARRGR